MRYKVLPAILVQEGDELFQRIEERWRPVRLLYVQQTRELLRDISQRYDQLSAALPELQTLNKPDTYTKLLTRMRLYVRQAGYAWRMDQLTFIRSVSGFYQDYGAVLRLLRIEQNRGRFVEEVPT